MGQAEPSRVFYVYAKDTQEDRRLLGELDKHLVGLVRGGLIERRHAGLLLAGDDFQRQAADAIAWADVLLLLVSADCLSSSECLDLLARARERGLRVVPVLLRRRLAAPPGPQRPGAAAAERQGGGELAAPGGGAGRGGLRQLLSASALAARPPSPQTPAIGPRTTVRQALRIAMRLDRTRQWEQVQAECDQRRHALLLLFGYRRQNLLYFLDRIRHYLAEERRDDHMVLDLPWQRGEAATFTGADLALRLKDQLALELALSQGSAPLRDLLQRMIEHRPLLIIVGQKPIDELPPKRRRALQDFLTVELPGALRDLPAGHPVRVLLCVDYLDPARSCVRAIAPWAGKANGERSPKKRGLHYCQLAEAALPDWPDVRDFLARWDPPLSSRRVDQIRKKYEELHRSDLSFHEIAEMLDRELGD